MKITPLEIRQKSFEKGFRGYDKDEVNAFLLSLSGEWERMIDENKDVRTKLEAALKEVEKLRAVENSLFKTLQTAESTGNTIMEQANKQAELEIKGASLKAEKMIEDARNQAQQTVETAERRSEAIVREMQEELKTLAQRFRELENYRDDVLSSLKGLSVDIQEKADRFRKHQPEVSLKELFVRAKSSEQQPRATESHGEDERENPPNRIVGSQMPRSAKMEEETVIEEAPSLEDLEAEVEAASAVEDEKEEITPAAQVEEAPAVVEEEMGPEEETVEEPEAPVAEASALIVEEVEETVEEEAPEEEPAEEEEAPVAEQIEVVDAPVADEPIEETPEPEPPMAAAEPEPTPEPEPEPVPNPEPTTSEPEEEEDVPSKEKGSFFDDLD